MLPKHTIQSLIIREDLNRISRHNFKKPQKKKMRTRMKDQAKTYVKIFMETASIHGLNHLVAPRRQYLEILLWLTFLVFSVIGTLYLSNLTWSRYQSSPTVVSMDKDMFAWNTTFPSVTICPDSVGHIDKEKMSKYLNNSSEQNKTRLENFIIGLLNATYKTFENVPEYPDIPPEKYLELVLNLSLPFEPKLTIDQVSGVVFTIEPTITEMGLCHAVNSRTGIYNSPEYTAANRWDIIPNRNQTLFIHPLDGEVFAKLTMNTTTLYNIYIHGPQEIPDITSKYQVLNAGYYLKMYVTALAVYTSAEAASLSVNQRRCRFPHENNLKHNTIYTYTMCRMECRIRLCLKYCQCIPHFYRRIGDEKICDVKGLHCLSTHKDVLYTLQGKDGKKINCGCFPLCDDINYVLQPIAMQKWILGTNLQLGMVTYPRMRYRRDIIFGFTDVLVAVGGMAGLFLGCNVLSFMEIVYFLTLRLWCYGLGYRS